MSQTHTKFTPLCKLWVTPFRKYESGAVGTFTHCVALKDHDYSCELEVFADGYQMKYVTSTNRIADPHQRYIGS